MSLMICPDCGNECSTTAKDCPNCGHVFLRPAAPPASRIVVRDVEEKSGIPKWIFIPLAILGATLLFVGYMMLNREDETANKNVNVRITSSTPLSTTTSSAANNEVSIPSSSAPSQITIPSSSAPSMPPPSVSTSATIPSAPPPSTTTTIPDSTSAGSQVAVAPDKGTVNLEAKIFSKSGTQLPVNKEKFYLLDKDLYSILSEAKIDDPEGQGVVNAFALSVVNPKKYSDTNQKALAAIKKHIVYSTLTDANGKGEIKGIKPGSFYLFGIKTVPNGFAMWDSQVSIQPGQNNLVLEPKTPTEVVTAPE